MSDIVKIDHYLTPREVAAVLGLTRQWSRNEMFNVGEMLENKLGGGRPVDLTSIRAVCADLGLDVQQGEVATLKAAAAKVTSNG